MSTMVGLPRKGNWSQTFTGLIYPLDPREYEINIEDIAHHLSMQCRFAGACKFHYSVAQHAIYVSQQVPKEWALWGLLHDASEAYLGDLVRPLKLTAFGAGYQVHERRLQIAICKKFGLLLPDCSCDKSPLVLVADGNEEDHAPECNLSGVLEPALVIQADKRMLMTEKRDIMAPPPIPWGDAQSYQAEPYSWNIGMWTPRTAETRFLERYRALMKEAL